MLTELYYINRKMLHEQSCVALIGLNYVNKIHYFTENTLMEFHHVSRIT